MDDFRRKYPQAKDLYSNFTDKYLARVNRLMELDNEIKTQCNDGNILICLQHAIFTHCVSFFYRIPGFNSECYEIASGDPESEVPFIPGEIESTCSVCGRKHGNRRIR